MEYVCIKENGNLLIKDLFILYFCEIIQILDKDIIYFVEKFGVYKLQDIEIYLNVFKSILSGNIYKEQ